MSNISMNKYKFIGKPDRVFPDLVHGKTYILTIENRYAGFWGWIFGIYRPVIIAPIRCPYSSYYTFRDNWEIII